MIGWLVLFGIIFVPVATVFYLMSLLSRAFAPSAQVDEEVEQMEQENHGAD